MKNKIDFKIHQKITPLEEAAFEVVKILQENNFETYIAGGAVRDLFLERELHDIDIATAAKPEEVKKIFPRSYDRGKAFGVVAVENKDFEFEVATFRNDIGISDHRRPVTVEFTTAEQDALRRDFTINALFFDPIKSEIIDYTNGMADLENKIVRFVGEPKQRIEEDYLRMLRAVRFVCRLGFELDTKAEEEITKNAAKITAISIERIREELTIIIFDQNRREALIYLESLGLLEVIFPELIALKGVAQPPEFHSEGDVWTHTLMAMASLKAPSAELAWTVLLHDIAKPQTQGFREHPKSKITFFEHDIQSAEMTRKILERFKFSNTFVESAVWAISQHMRIVNAFCGMSERKQKKLFTHPHIQLLLDLTKADLGASIRPDGQSENKMYFEAVKKKEQFEKEVENTEKQQVKKFTLINGSDIMTVLKIPAGPQVGKIKTKIEEAFLDEKITTRQEALEMIKDLK